MLSIDACRPDELDVHEEWIRRLIIEVGHRWWGVIAKTDHDCRSTQWPIMREAVQE